MTDDPLFDLLYPFVARPGTDLRTNVTLAREAVDAVREWAQTYDWAEDANLSKAQIDAHLARLAPFTPADPPPDPAEDHSKPLYAINPSGNRAIPISYSERAAAQMKIRRAKIRKQPINPAWRAIANAQPWSVPLSDPDPAPGDYDYTHPNALSKEEMQERIGEEPSGE